MKKVAGLRHAEVDNLCLQGRDRTRPASLGDCCNSLALVEALHAFVRQQNHSNAELGLRSADVGALADSEPTAQAGLRKMCFLIGMVQASIVRTAIVRYIVVPVSEKHFPRSVAKQPAHIAVVDAFVDTIVAGPKGVRHLGLGPGHRIATPMSPSPLPFGPALPVPHFDLEVVLKQVAQQALNAALQKMVVAMQDLGFHPQFLESVQWLGPA